MVDDCHFEKLSRFGMVQPITVKFGMVMHI